jgi:hypothetical protein
MMKRIVAALFVGVGPLVACGGGGSSPADNAKAGCKALNKEIVAQFSNLQDPSYVAYAGYRRGAAAFRGELPAKIRSQVDDLKSNIGPTEAAQTVVACVDQGYLTKKEANFG